ncbi:hypothetical protein ASD64_09100 [Mesorhizobium sp. Root157]|nr:hypothetical protein ASD64_09100 [Mesorhizobium sp. Root157]
MTSDDIETLGARIKYARKAAKRTQSEVAAHFGISRVSVTQWESDKTKPEVSKIGDLAGFLDTSVDFLIERKGAPPIAVEVKSLPGDPRSRAIPGNELIGARDMPVYAAAMGGDGHMLISFEAIDYVKRPAALQSVKGGYGILVSGDSMIPAYWPGDTALVNPNLPAHRDTDVVLYHTPPKERGEAQAIIKRLIGINDREWRLEQYKPSNEFSESRIDWPVCHRVVGKYNAR